MTPELVAFLSAWFGCIGVAPPMTWIRILEKATPATAAGRAFAATIETLFKGRPTPAAMRKVLDPIVGQDFHGLTVIKWWSGDHHAFRWACVPLGTCPVDPPVKAWNKRVRAERIEAKAVADAVMERRAAEPLPVAPGPVGLTAADRKTINSFKVPAPESVPLATAMHAPPAVRDERYAGIGTIPQEVSSGEFNRAWNDHQARERLNGPPRRRWTPFDV